MPALLTKMSRVPKASAVLATAARSSSAEPLSALRDSALPPADSISRTSSRAFSGELEYVKATDAPSAASRRTMPAPMPLEPPVTRATLPLNDFDCICHHNPLSHLLCPLWIILSRMLLPRDSFPRASCRTDVAKAVGKCVSAHKNGFDPLKAIALGHAMGGRPHFRAVT